MILDVKLDTLDFWWTSQVNYVNTSTVSTLLHGKINPKGPKDWQVLSLGDRGFLQFLGVVSSDYGKPRKTSLPHSSFQVQYRMEPSLCSERRNFFHQWFLRRVGVDDIMAAFKLVDHDSIKKPICLSLSAVCFQVPVYYSMQKIIPMPMLVSMMMIFIFSDFSRMSGRS